MAGFRGIADFVGYSVGKPPPPAAVAGYRGILDFVGISAGVSGGAPPAVPELHERYLLVGIGQLLGRR